MPGRQPIARGGTEHHPHGRCSSSTSPEPVARQFCSTVMVSGVDGHAPAPARRRSMLSARAALSDASVGACRSPSPDAAVRSWPVAEVEAGRLPPCLSPEEPPSTHRDAARECYGRRRRSPTSGARPVHHFPQQVYPAAEPGGDRGFTLAQLPVAPLKSRNRRTWRPRISTRRRTQSTFSRLYPANTGV